MHSPGGGAPWRRRTLGGAATADASSRRTDCVGSPRQKDAVKLSPIATGPSSVKRSWRQSVVELGSPASTTATTCSRPMEPRTRFAGGFHFQVISMCAREYLEWICKSAIKRIILTFYAFVKKLFLQLSQILLLKLLQDIQH